jgi:NADH-quinone oxidoreductase subunit J
LGTELLLFYLFAAVAVIASVLVVGQRNPMHSVLLLIVSFAALAAIYLLLDAPFAAVIQIIIYAGAIMVLFLFVVMLLNAGREAAGEAGARPARAIRTAGAVLSAVLAAELVWAVGLSWRATGSVRPDGDPALVETLTSVRAIGRTLFTDYAFAFEVTSILILVSMVGAVVLAKRRADD